MNMTKWVPVLLAAAFVACDGGGDAGGGAAVDGGSATGDAARTADAGNGRDDAKDQDASTGPDASTATVSDPCAFAACGGELVGTWTYRTTCMTGLEAVLRTKERMQGGMTVPPPCPEAVITAQPAISGSITFEPDMRFETSLTFSGKWEFTAPTSCTAKFADCAAFADDTKIRDLTCAALAGGGCGCSLSSSDAGQMRGSYSVSGNEATLKPEGGSAQKTPYCVQGDVLKMNSGGMPIGATRAN